MTAALIPLILTRPEGSNSAILQGLSDDARTRLRVIESPLTEIAPLAVAVDLKGTDAVVFTSANAVRFAPAGAGRKAFCVGSATSAAARSAGWDAIEAGADAEGLIATLTDAQDRLRLLHLSGIHVRGNIVDRLSAAGYTVRAQAVYDQRLLPLTDLACQVLEADPLPIVPLFSPRTARHFAGLLPANSRVRCIALSEAVAEPVRHPNVEQLVVARSPDRRAMTKALEKILTQ